jgi:hypothetical protein
MFMIDWRLMPTLAVFQLYHVFIMFIITVTLIISIIIINFIFIINPCILPIYYISGDNILITMSF